MFLVSNAIANKSYLSFLGIMFMYEAY